MLQQPNQSKAEEKNSDPVTDEKKMKQDEIDEIE